MKFLGNKFAILVIIAITALGFYLLKNQNSSTNENDPSKLQIVTSFYPLYFFAQEIVKDDGAVYVITPAGVEPHDYEPTPQDIAKIERSSLLIVNGAGFEPWADEVIQNLKEKPVKVIDVSKTLSVEPLINKNQERVNDPHVWLDPQLASKQVVVIANALKEVDPTNSRIYEANTTNLLTKLEALNQAYKNGLATCARKDFITSHAAFGYLARAYNLQQVTIAGVNPDQEPSPKELAEVAQFAKENNVTHIFFETLVSPKLSETLAKEVGAQTLVLNPLEGLSDDEMSDGKDYFSVMQENLINLRTALQCK